MSVMEMFNSKPLYSIVIIGLLFIISICFAFYKKAKDQALKLGHDEEKIKTVVKSSIIFSIVPSISIVLALFTLSTVLGVPWSWFRLSVVGSLSYELMASELAVTGAGYASLADFIQGNDTEIVTTIMLVMSISILGGITFNTIFGKKIQTRMLDFQEKNSEWGTIAMGYFTLSIAAVFIPIQLTQGIVSLAVLVVSSLIAIIHIYLIKKKNMTWLSEFMMANTLILGMISSVFLEKILL